MNINKKITFILNIGAYSTNSGWSRAMHRLATLLHQRGENVYTLAEGPKNFPYKILTQKDKSPIPDFSKLHHCPIGFKIKSFISSNPLLPGFTRC